MDASNLLGDNEVGFVQLKLKPNPNINDWDMEVIAK